MTLKTENADDDNDALEALETEAKEFNKVTFSTHMVFWSKAKTFNRMQK